MAEGQDLHRRQLRLPPDQARRGAPRPHRGRPRRLHGRWRMIPVPNKPAYSRSPFKIRHDQSGVHLFNRRSGWNILLDEICPPHLKWATAPRQVSIALTNACDLNCSYCFAPKARSALDFDQIVSWAHELDANGTLGVGFGGGEPTLYPRFAELCAHVAEHTAMAVTF